MDKRKTYYCILDTETTATTSPEENKKKKVIEKLVYDLGYTIATKKEIVLKRNFLIQEIFCNEQLMNNAYFISKKPMYDRMVENNQVEVIPLATAVKRMQEDFKEYNVTKFCAYNVSFDLDALMQTVFFIYRNIFKRLWKKTRKGTFIPDTELFLKKVILHKEDIEILDLWTLSCQTLCNQKTFQAFYKQLSEKGNVKSNAEIVYNYINGTTNFEEEHTALNDAIIETEILQRIVKIHQKITSKWTCFPFRMINK